MDESRPPFPPFTLETATQKVRMAEDAWNTRDPQRVSPPHSSERHDRFFTGPYQRRVVPIAGHLLPRETPEAVVQAVRELGS